MNRLILIILTLICIAGCSSLKVVPEAVEGGVIHAQENAQSLTRGALTVTASSSDMEIVSYNLDGSVASFLVVVENQGDAETEIGTDSFLLLDDSGRQYFPLTPEKVKEMIARNTYYLIPYPYVGFYYMEDYQKSSFNNRFTSDSPYYYELYPQDIYTKAMPTGSVIPKAKVAGLIYFRIDLENKKGVTLQFFKKGTPKSSPADFAFPFKIVK